MQSRLTSGGSYCELLRTISSRAERSHVFCRTGGRPVRIGGFKLCHRERRQQKSWASLWSLTRISAENESSVRVLPHGIRRFSGPIPSVNLAMIAFPGTVHFWAGKRTAQRHTYAPFFPVLQYNQDLQIEVHRSNHQAEAHDRVMVTLDRLLVSNLRCRLLRARDSVRRKAA